MGFYISINGYYEGDLVSPEDQEVPQRPSPAHIWNGEWILSKSLHNAMIDEELDELERKAIMPRGAREAWIAQCKQIATAQGSTDAQALAANPFYAKLVEQNNAAIALRAQRLK